MISSGPGRFRRRHTPGHRHTICVIVTGVTFHTLIRVITTMRLIATRRVTILLTRQKPLFRPVYRAHIGSVSSDILEECAPCRRPFDLTAALRRQFDRRYHRCYDDIDLAAVSRIHIE